jgi:RHS repeat-associated protein
VNFTNSVIARYEEVVIDVNPGTGETRTVFIPKTPESFTHDTDGNLKTDGRWVYQWDAENRLISMTSRTDLPAAMPRRKIEFVYDYMSRRSMKNVYKVVGGDSDDGASDGGSAGETGDDTSDPGPAVPVPTWELLYTIKYVWDGWNLVAELTGSDNVLRAYSWGLDLSGSPKGAGGIGGLLFVWDAVNDSAGTKHYHAAYDGNGNLVRLGDTAGNEAAAYEYGPFGELLESRGAYGGNPFRFSTKYADAETGLYYYGYRYYNASTGRWLSRDPIEEAGGCNLLAMVLNSPVLSVDPLGLDNYRIGWDDPYVRRDRGAGFFASVDPTTERQLLKFAIITEILPNVQGVWPDAAKHMRHYFGRSGRPLTIRLDGMIREVPSARELYEYERSEAMRFVQTLDPGTYDITSGSPSPGRNRQDESLNWFLAVHGYAAWGKGRATVSCKDGVRSYRLEFDYKFLDRYNWDTGKSVTVYGITVTDKFMGDFHRMGLAHEFEMNGTVTEVIEWKNTTPPRERRWNPSERGRR